MNENENNNNNNNNNINELGFPEIERLNPFARHLTDKEDCICQLNQFGQCTLNYVWSCAECQCCLRQWTSMCPNSECKYYMKSFQEISRLNNQSNYENIDLATLALESNLQHEYYPFHHVCEPNEFNQCKKGYKYFCACGMGISGMYSMCTNVYCK